MPSLLLGEMRVTVRQTALVMLQTRKLQLLQFFFFHLDYSIILINGNLLNGTTASDFFCTGQCKEKSLHLPVN